MLYMVIFTINIPPFMLALIYQHQQDPSWVMVHVEITISCHDIHKNPSRTRLTRPPVNVKTKNELERSTMLWIKSTISTGPWLLCRYHKSASKRPMEIYEIPIFLWINPLFLWPWLLCRFFYGNPRPGMELPWTMSDSAWHPHGRGRSAPAPGVAGDLGTHGHSLGRSFRFGKRRKRGDFNQGKMVIFRFPPVFFVCPFF